MDERSSTTAPSPVDVEHAFAKREAWAFEAAYFMHRHLLYSAAYAVLLDRDDAEDCVHDVMVRLWKSGNAYTTARGSLKSFLTVCVRNEALSRRRKTQNRTRIASANLDVNPTTASFENELVEHDRLSTALQRLNDDQRAAIQLAYYEGLTLAETAERLAQPLGTVKSRVSAALRNLRGALA